MKGIVDWGLCLAKKYKKGVGFVAAGAAVQLAPFVASGFGWHVRLPDQGALSLLIAAAIGVALRNEECPAEAPLAA